MEPIVIRFCHGLGDTAHFVHSLPLYTRRGYRFKIVCDANKLFLYTAAGVEAATDGDALNHPWEHAPNGCDPQTGEFWIGNKAAFNLSRPPMPDIGLPGELWDEYCQVQCPIGPHIPEQVRRRVEGLVAELARPLVLLHPKGNTCTECKDLGDALTVGLCKRLIDMTDGTIVLLDWDNRVPRLASYRIRHSDDDWGGLGTAEFLALVDSADLLVGIDSGPLHAARFTDTPALGVWTRHHPVTYALPRDRTLHVTLRDPTHRFARVPFNIVECESESEFSAGALGELCVRLASPPRYLGDGQIARDVQLQHFVARTRGAESALGGYSDRHRGFDAILREATNRFDSPVIVETGAIRAEEDWAGAGFSTYLFGAYCWLRRGKLYSIDWSPECCAVARACTAVFGSAVELVQDRGRDWLARCPCQIDVLHLDSLDTESPEHAEENFAELQHAIHRLHDRSIVACDDTAWSAGRFIGKGAISVPWMLERGWAVLYGGHQTVLVRKDV